MLHLIITVWNLKIVNFHWYPNVWSHNWLFLQKTVSWLV